MTVPPAGEPPRHQPRPQRPADAPGERTQPVNAHRPPLRPQGPFQGQPRPPQAWHPAAGAPAPRRFGTAQVIVTAVVGLAVLGAVIVAAIDISASGSESSGSSGVSGIPDEFRTPLGCDIRNSGLQICTERAALTMACPMGMDRVLPAPATDQGFAGSGLSSIWNDGRQPIAEVIYVPVTDYVWLRSKVSSCFVELAPDEWNRLSIPGETIPAALR